MLIKDVLKKGIDRLKVANIDAPAADAGVLLCHVLDCDRAYLYAHSEDIIEKIKLDEFNLLVKKRCSGMPVQYITGHQEFMSLDFYVEQGVLIPRPDTEILVEAVISICRTFDRKVKILDIGTGSGCIAVSLAYYVKNCDITTLDISEKALHIAYRNALKNGVADKIDFVKSDLFHNINQSNFDIIVSNPPYICKDEIKTLQREVRDYEPPEALDGGEDGLDFYRIISEKAPLFLKKGGYVAFEVGYKQAVEVKDIMLKNFTELAVQMDLAGIERVVIGKRL